MGSLLGCRWFRDTGNAADRATIMLRGVEADISFSLNNYEDDFKQNPWVSSPISTNSDHSYNDADKNPQDLQISDNSSKVLPKDSNSKALQSWQTEDHKDNWVPELFLLVQIERENILKVNVTAPSSVNIAFKEIELPKHQAKKINFSITVGGSPTIVLNAGNGGIVYFTLDCQYQKATSSGRFPSYGTRHPCDPHLWCLLFVSNCSDCGRDMGLLQVGKRERRGDGDVQYQELEIGLPEFNVSHQFGHRRWLGIRLG
ncbi:hypothetical protein HHK36_016017 [Tetracentron sinense]|uniref:DUF7356 domain-containing protein n=1 Tax=Tetracentron sinense TaxID=13715 RepID=A0A834Z0N5_TETSI|nr:hypothetical protein HHK36_016017 [Tetracentron sinense]